VIKILIVDNHPIVRTGLELHLGNKPGFSVVGSLSNGLEIFDFVKQNNVDVIISEIDLPELNGITALRALKKEHKHLKILMLSHQPDEIYAVSAIKAGASGYLNKVSSIEAIEQAILKIYSGDTALSNNVNGANNSVMTNTLNMFKKLSTREVEVLKLLSIGKKNKAIACELHINEKTVSTYKSRLYKKLNVTNIVDLIHQARFHNLS